MRVLEALSRAFIALSRARPLLVVLEDLHWAGQPTFDALAFLARRAVASRILFLVTYRDDEAHRRHPLRRLQREAEFEGSASSISLAHLDASAVGAILRSTTGGSNEASGDFTAAMYERSNGNPLFLAQLLAAPEFALSETPPTIATLVGTRFATLSEPARTVAEIAALAGQRFSPDVVYEVSGWSDASVLTAIDELLDRRIVGETTGRGAFRYAFTHQLVQRAIVESIDPSRIRERRRRIGYVLEQLYPERADELAEEIARHLEAGGEAAAAALRFLTAARRALSIGALEDGLRAVDRGLRLSADPAAVRALLLVREEINERSADADAQRADLDALQAIAEQTGDDDLRCTVLLHRAKLTIRQSDPGAAAILDELRERARSMQNVQWQANADLTHSTLLTVGLTVEDALGLARRACDAYSSIGDEAGMANALAILARGLTYRGEVLEARALVERALSIAQRCGKYEARLRAVRVAAAIAMEMGDSDRVTEMTARWLELSISAGDREDEAMALSQSAWPAASSFNFSAALPILERAATICREWKLRAVGAMVDVNSAEIWMRLGTFQAAIPLLERAIAFYAAGAALRPSSVARSNLALAFAYAGSSGRAVELARQAKEFADAVGAAPQRAATLENMAEAQWRHGNRNLAIESLESALALRSAGQSSLSIVKDCAFLAALYGEAGDLAKAAGYAARVSSDESTLCAGNLWPQRSAWATAYAHYACGDRAAARDWLQRALHLYDAFLEHLSGPHRQSFAALPWHAALVAASQGRWPETVW